MTEIKKGRGRDKERQKEPVQPVCGGLLLSACADHYSQIKLAEPCKMFSLMFMLSLIWPNPYPPF